MKPQWKTFSQLSLTFILLVTALLTLTLSTSASPVTTPHPDERVDITYFEDSLYFASDLAFEALDLTVGEPGGKVTHLSLEGPGGLSFELLDDSGGFRADGIYAYELRGTLETGESTLLDSGFFSVRERSIVSPLSAELGEDTHKDQTITDNLIVDGSACIGGDCEDGELFGFHTLILKENNTQIRFEDTSDALAFPRLDWELRANETNNGGADLFTIVQCNDTSCSRNFTIMGDAPQNAMLIDAEGDLGLGTSVPEVEIHVVDGNSPILRLDQNGSEGYTPQVWDIGANEVQFFIRDETNSSNHPFTIKAGASHYSLYIDAAGNTGLGTNSPSAKLDVDGDIALAGLVDGRDVSADGAAFDGHLGDLANPHQVTAAQVGADSAGTAASEAASQSAAAVSEHQTTFNHDNLPSALPVPISEGGTGANDGAAALAALGGASQASLDGHLGDRDNPHQVTAAQVGADAAGTAVAEAASQSAAAVGEHETAFNHGNLPSALPVPVAEGGTGATDAATARANLGLTVDSIKAGMIAPSAFFGDPATVRVDFVTPYPPGTGYVVMATAKTGDKRRTYTTNVLAQDELGFTLTLGQRAQPPFKGVAWLVRPVGE